MDERLNGFFFFASYDEALEALRDIGDSEGELFLSRAIRNYIFRDTEPESFPNRIIKGYWELIRPNLESSLKSARKYQSSVENGKLGGRPKKNPTNNPDHNPTKTQQSEKVKTQTITQPITQTKPNHNPDETQHETQQIQEISGFRGDCNTENKNPTKTQTITQPITQMKPRQNPEVEKSENPDHNPAHNPDKTRIRIKDKDNNPPSSNTSISCQLSDTESGNNILNNNIYNTESIGTDQRADSSVTEFNPDKNAPPLIPELEDIEKFIKDKGAEEYTSAVAFFNYYSDRGWHTATGTWINWVGALSGWIDKDRKEYERRQKNSALSRAERSKAEKKKGFRAFDERSPEETSDLEKKLLT